MKVKDVINTLQKYPEDMEVIISYTDSIGEYNTDCFMIEKVTINHCNYTTKWQSEIDYYSSYEETHSYVDQIKGKKHDVEIAMTKKDVILIGV